MTAAIREELRAFHSAHPYRPGIPKAEVHMRFMKQVKPNVFDLYIEMLTEEGKIGAKRRVSSQRGLYDSKGRRV